MGTANAEQEPPNSGDFSQYQAHDNPTQETGWGEMSVNDYYARYLRKKHPEYSEEEIKQTVEIEMANEMFRDFVQGSMQVDAEIREKYPHLNWTTWFDDLLK